MNIYFNNKFTGHYPVGTSALVVADTPEKACCLLNDRLMEDGLNGDARVSDMIQMPTTYEQVVVLNDGNY